MAGEYLAEAVERIPLSGHDGRPGALLERVTLADGCRRIVKRFSAGTDLLMTLMGDKGGREYADWSRGILDLLPPRSARPLVDGWVDGWVDGDETVVVMRDIGDSVLTWNNRLTCDQCRRIMAAISAQHCALLRPGAPWTAGCSDDLREPSPA